MRRGSAVGRKTARKRGKFLFGKKPTPKMAQRGKRR